MTPIRVYVEGGGGSKLEKITLRRGFEAFFAKLGPSARQGVGVHPCGGRDATHSTFERALHADPHGYKLLLVDSDGPVDGEVCEYLAQRWGLYCGGDSRQYHLMVQAFEAWIIADAAALKRFYGAGFLAGELPHGYATVEAIPKAQLKPSLVAATHQSSEGTYHKIDHASKLLEHMDPQTVRDAVPHCRRLLCVLEAKPSRTRLTWRKGLSPSGMEHRDSNLLGRQALMWCLLAGALLVAGAVVAAPWQPDEYPIGYWYGPPSEANTLETWRTVKECNFTFAGMSGYSVEENRKMLDLCQEAGAKAMVIDSRISWQMVTGDGWRETLGEVVADYGSHPALYGYYIQDEPSYMLFSALGQVSQELEKRDPAHLPYINLFPTYASVEQLGTPTYADHLDKFLAIVKPRVLSYDHYCLLKDGTDRADYFENLALIREYGLRYNTPPWNIILSLPHLGYRDPTAGEMRWQVYTSLAYGMKGIMYFTYWTHPDWEKDGQIAIVDSQGKPARLYPIVQRLNAEIGALGKTLLGLTSTGVYHTGAIPQGCRRLGGDEIVRVPSDLPLVVGLFKDAAGVDYAMIVNADHAAPVEFEAAFKPHVMRVFQVSAEDGSESEVALADGKANLPLEPGDGRLLRLETAFSYAEPPEPVTKIDFRFDEEADAEGWGAMGGTNSVSIAGVTGGSMTLTIAGPDPFICRTFLGIPPDTYSTIKVRMKIAGGDTEGQLFWTTADEPGFADDKYLNFPITPDGEWHEYTIPVGEHAKWRGQAIRALRLDPTTGGAETGSQVEIDSVIGE